MMYSSELNQMYRYLPVYLRLLRNHAIRVGATAWCDAKSSDWMKLRELHNDGSRQRQPQLERLRLDTQQQKPTRKMASVPTVKAPGLFTQRHVDALYSVPSIFTPETIHKATLPTGVTVEYALLGAGPVIATAAGEAPSEAHEDRVVMVMGFSQHKEEWAPFIRMLFDKYKNGGQKKPLRILTLDNRGIGGTDAPLGRYRTSDMAQDVLALMSHVGWERAHVVGFR